MSKAETLRFAMFGLLATLAPLASSAGQERQMGGDVGITVFTSRNFHGRSATFREDVPVLSRFGLNDRIASLRVARGEQWEVCANNYFKGRCVVISGQESNLARNAWANVISSLRRVTGPATPPTTLPAPAPPSDWYIVLFDQPNFRGTPTNYTRAMSSLSRAATRSVTIGKGVWELCEGANFSGRCVTLEQSASDLGRYGFRGRVVSVRPLVRQPR